jgi:hypothetical protein
MLTGKTFEASSHSRLRTKDVLYIIAGVITVTPYFSDNAILGG